MGKRAQRDGEDEATDGSSERTCAVTRAKLAPEELIRFVRAPDGTITPDLARKLPGRGVWVGLDRATVDKAATQNAFARSLKAPVVVPDELGARVDDLLVKRALQALALANKSGLVVCGFAKVEAAIGSERVAALIHASDAAEDGAQKLDRKLRAATAEDNSPPKVVRFLAGSDLSLAMGRPHVVHALLIQGGAAQFFLNEIDRLGRFRSSTSAADSRLARQRSNTEQV
ncbi:MAG: RNA-binding protein [Proteobacteria bacterium]|nr:RNA-binding protein [Pseudomonadota bacterium]